MADRTIVGSLLITAEVDGGPFAAGMANLSRRTTTATGRMRKNVDNTTRSVDRLRHSTNKGFRTHNFVAASRAFGDMNKRAEFLRTTMLGLMAVFGGFSAALATNALTSYADSYTELQNRLRIVTSSQVELIAVEEQLFKVAARSRVGVKESAILYSRLAVSSKKLGLSQKQLLQVTETIQKAFIAGGSTPIEAAQSSIQLSQGIASDRLGGDELRSVLENQALGQLLANQISDGDIGKFREMAHEGEVTAQVLVKAFLNAGKDIELHFGKTVSTIGQALTVLDNEFTKYIGKQDKALGASEAISKGLIELSENIEEVGDAIVFLGTIMVARFAGGALNKATFAMADYISVTKAARLATVAETAAVTASAAAKQVEATASLKAAGQKAVAATATNQSLATQTALTRSTAAAHMQLQAATIASTTATAGHAAALKASTVAGVAATSTMRGLSAAMAFFGGPIGLAITGMAAGLYYLSTRQSQADKAASAHADAMETLREKIILASGASADQQEELQREAQGHLKTAKATLENAEAQLVLQEAVSKQRKEMAEKRRGFGLSVLNSAGTPGVVSDVEEIRLRAYRENLEKAKKQVKETKEAIGVLEMTIRKGVTSLDNGGETIDKKLTKKLKELRIEAAAASLAPLDREVSKIARQAGIAEEAITKFINAAKTGDLEGVDANILNIRDLQSQINAFETYRSILQSTGPTLTEVNDKQRELNFLMAQGHITSLQASESFADFITKFEGYGAINDVSNAFGDFVRSTRNGFDDIGEAALKFTDRIQEIAYEILVVEPLVQALRSSIAGVAGSGLFSGGSVGGSSPSLFGSLYHGGGKVGSGGPKKAVPASAFIGAPRFHGGLSSKEFAAILEKGEHVLTEDQANTTANVMTGLTNSKGSVSQVVVSVDDDGKLQAYVREESARTAGQVVAGSAPGIVSQAKGAVGGGIANGDYDASLSGYGIKQQAKVG